MKALRIFFGLIALVALSQSAIAQSTTPDVYFVYFGTSGCPYCRGWKTFDLPKLKESEAFKKARFVEIEKGIKADIPSSSSFPPEIAPYRDAVAQRFNGKIGSPMFAIVAGDKVPWVWRGVPPNATVIAELEKAEQR